MNNTIGQILKVIGAIIIGVGILLGLVVASETNPYVRRLALLPGIYPIISSFVVGMLFIGFGEVINILHEINLKIEPSENSPMTKKYLSSEVACDGNEDKAKENQDWEPDSRDYSQIKEFFEGKEDSIGKIIKAPFESIYAVKSSDGIYLIETGGFKPKLISDEDNPELSGWVKNNVN